MRRSSKLPTDPNKLAHEIVRLSTEEPAKEERSAISKYLAEIGRRGGLRGGPARSKKLTKKQRIEIARKAALSRWQKETLTNKTKKV